MPNSQRKADERSIQTRAQLLEAAEQLFSDRGYKGASMREITKRAGTNIASSHYHFGGKEALFREVLLNYANIINEKRLRILAEEQNHDSVNTIIKALISPFFEYMQENPIGGTCMARLMARIPHEIPEVAFPLFQEMFLPSLKELDDKLRQLLPHLNDDDFHWFLHCVRALFFHTVSTVGQHEQISDFYPWTIKSQEALGRLQATCLKMLQSEQENTLIKEKDALVTRLGS